MKKYYNIVATFNGSAEFKHLQAIALGYGYEWTGSGKSVIPCKIGWNYVILNPASKTMTAQVSNNTGVSPAWSVNEFIDQIENPIEIPEKVVPQLVTDLQATFVYAFFTRVVNITKVTNSCIEGYEIKKGHAMVSPGSFKRYSTCKITNLTLGVKS